MNENKISVNIVTNRVGGLDSQLRYFAKQTFKNFGIVIVDDLWDERHEEIEDLIRELCLDVVYRKQQRKRTDNVVTSLHSMVRNEALTYSDTSYVVFVDDYEIPVPNLIEEYVKYLDPKTAVIGKVTDLNYTDINNPDYNNIKAEDHRYKELNEVKKGYYSWFWTNNSAALLDALLDINGFDERFVGGSGGEDTAVGLALDKLDFEFICNPNALCYHVDHDTVADKKEYEHHLWFNKPPGNFIFEYQGHTHNLAAFVKTPYYDGNPDLMENEQFKCWRDKWGIKHYRCKRCGIEGVCDSIEIHDIKAKEGPVSSIELFDLRAAREKFKKEMGGDKYVR